MFETGIKVIDLLAPYAEGRQGRPVRRRRRRQDGDHPGADPQSWRKEHGGLSVHSAGVGERSREGNDLWLEMKESGVIKLGDNTTEGSKMALVFGQMNEPPGAPACGWRCRA